MILSESESSEGHWNGYRYRYCTAGRYLPSPQDNTKNQSYLEVGGRARGMPCLRHCNVVTCKA